MPQVAELPPDLQREYLEEKRKAEARRQRKVEQLKRKADAAAKAKEREEQAARAELQSQAELEASIAHLEKVRAEERRQQAQLAIPTPEQLKHDAIRSLPILGRPVKKENYGAIHVFATINAIAAALTVLAGFLTLISALSDDASPGIAAIGVGILVMGVWGLAFSELLRLAVHVATDIRDTRALTTRIRELLEPDESETLR
jgi:hypothetical protein